MIEPYQWYLEHANELGFVKEHIGPASVDLCVHQEMVCMQPYRDPRLAHMPPQVFSIFSEGLGHFLLEPGRFYLASTVEYIKVPMTHAATVQMRSSLARRGLGHKMAGYIDPGFEGQITLELSCDIPVTIPHHERIVQVIYHRLTEPTQKPYSGKYQGQRGPTEAYTV